MELVLSSSVTVPHIWISIKITDINWHGISYLGSELPNAWNCVYLSGHRFIGIAIGNLCNRVNRGIVLILKSSLSPVFLFQLRGFLPLTSFIESVLITTELIPGVQKMS